MIDTANNLTAREKEITQLLAKGMTYLEMGKLLGVTKETVKKHLKNIYQKLQVQNKIEALNKLRLL
jgi:two-component system, NarL family, response regulator LiaR